MEHPRSANGRLTETESETFQALIVWKYETANWSLRWQGDEQENKRIKQKILVSTNLPNISV